MRPNEVYERTRVGLADLVPGRAARRILDDGLGQHRCTAEAVSADEMGQVLLGPVYRGLKGVLPRFGLRRQLKALARDLRTLEPSPPPKAATPPPDSRALLIRGTEVPTPPAPAAPSPEAATATPLAEPVSAPRALPTDPSRVLAALATLDGVDGIGVFHAAGEVVTVRGDIAESESLGRVIAAGGGLLGRSGAIRTICVTTTHGVLVAVSVPPQWLAVTGGPDLNLGAIYAALAALEEER
jgi:hypothetical protein